MGTIILIIAVVVEAAFTTACIIARSNQPQVKSFVRIGAFAAFVVFTLVSVIQWSSRWYLLFTLLLVWAALGAWTLIRKQEAKKEYKTAPVVLKAIATLLLVVVATTPALIFPQSKLPKVTGGHKVATVNYTYSDQSRIETFTQTGANRKVNVEFWYPQDTGAAGKFPLVVFSHGAFGVKTSNTSTFMELASNGYVVCSIDHPYHSLITKDADGHSVTIDPSFIQEVMGANNGKYDEKTALELEQKWMKLRTTDMQFVLNTIIEQAKDAGSGQVYQLINTEKIGLMGHSLGGAASAQVGRERTDIGAVIDLDADLSGEYLDYVDGKPVINDQLYPVPILIIYTDELVRRFAGIADLNHVVASKKVAASAPQAYEVNFTGTNHMSLTDVPLMSPFLVTLMNSSFQSVGGSEADPLSTVEKMNSLVLEFFNDYLKDEGSFASAGTY
jgi:dienelactone hydrolase